jgi:hypothetical protein
VPPIIFLELPIIKKPVTVVSTVNSLAIRVSPLVITTLLVVSALMVNIIRITLVPSVRTTPHVAPIILLAITVISKAVTVVSTVHLKAICVPPVVITTLLVVSALPIIIIRMTLVPSVQSLAYVTPVIITAMLVVPPAAVLPVSIKMAVLARHVHPVVHRLMVTQILLDAVYLAPPNTATTSAFLRTLVLAVTAYKNAESDRGQLATEWFSSVGGVAEGRGGLHNVAGGRAKMPNIK